jgi:flagellar biosynthetic protein FlhB
MLLAAAGVLSFGGGTLYQSLASMLAQGLQGAASFSIQHAFDLAATGATATLPLLTAVFLAALIAPLLLSGWVFAPRVMEFEPGRLNPLRPLRRLFSIDGWYGGLKALLALVVLGAMIWSYLRHTWQELLVPWGSALRVSFSGMATWLGKGLLIMAGALALIALLDALWQWRRHLTGLAMTRGEALAEAQEEEMSAAMRARMAGVRERVQKEAAE